VVSEHGLGTYGFGEVEGFLFWLAQIELFIAYTFE